MPTLTNLKPHIERSQLKRLGVILAIVLVNVGVLLLLTASAAAGLKTEPQATGLYDGVNSAATATGVAAGSMHTCAVVDGGAKCWGYNEFGQLGNGTTTPSSPPAWVSGLSAGSGVTAIAAGYGHTCAIVQGGVQCWGYNNLRQLGITATTNISTPVWVSGLGAGSGVTAIAAGSYHTCAVVDNLAQCWGYNTSGQLGRTYGSNYELPSWVNGMSPGSGVTVTAIAAGGSHSCAVVGGGAKCWGANWGGQLGQGTTGNFIAAPVWVSDLGEGSGVTTLAAGEGHTCAVVGGGMQCWGRNYAGQLGDGTLTDSYVPVAVSDLGSGVVAIAAGQMHTCAVLDGGARCWGGNGNSQIGDGSRSYMATPVEVSGLGAGRGVTAVAGGYYHTCAVAGGGVKCWGNNQNGQLGVGGRMESFTPVWANGLGAGSGVTAITAGSYHTCAVVAGGARCWGENWNGQLGNGTTVGWFTPAGVSGLPAGSGVTALAAGDTHTCAAVAGGARCWGYNDLGQLGIGSTDSISVPVEVSGLGAGNGLTVTAIAAGSYTTCAIAGGGAMCWGDNAGGQLGIGSTDSISVPVPVSGLGAGSGVTALTAGWYHTCAVIGGGAMCWGWNESGQLGIGSTVNISVPVGVSGLGSDVTAIAAGANHTCAVAGGGVMCWGDNSNGQLGIGSTDGISVPVGVSGLDAGSGVTAIAALGYHTCAVVSGGVKCWGDNSYGQLGNGTQTQSPVPVDVIGLPAGSGVTALAINSQHTCAVAGGGGVKCWGTNYSGQLGINPGWLPVDVFLGAPVYLPFVRR